MATTAGTTSTRNPAAGHVVGRVGSGGVSGPTAGAGGAFTDANMQVKLQRAREAMAKRQDPAGAAGGVVPVDTLGDGGERV